MKKPALNLSEETISRFQDFSLNFSSIKAVEVTEEFLITLPQMGSKLQRYGFQVEIAGRPPHNKKTYAKQRDYLIWAQTADGEDIFLPMERTVFDSLFSLPSAPVESVAVEAAVQFKPVVSIADPFSTPKKRGRPPKQEEVSVEETPANFE